MVSPIDIAGNTEEEEVYKKKLCSNDFWKIVQRFVENYLNTVKILIMIFER